MNEFHIENTATLSILLKFILIIFMIINIDDNTWIWWFNHSIPSRHMCAILIVQPKWLSHVVPQNNPLYQLYPIIHPLYPSISCYIPNHAILSFFSLVFAHVLKPRGIFLLVKSPHFRLNHCDWLPISAEIPWIFWWNIMFFSGDRWYLHFCWWHLQFLMGKSHFFCWCNLQVLPNISFCQAPPLGKVRLPTIFGSLAIAWGLHTERVLPWCPGSGWPRPPPAPSSQQMGSVEPGLLSKYTQIMGATWRSESEVKMFSLLRDLFNFSGYHLATMGWGHPSWPIPHMMLEARRGVTTDNRLFIWPALTSDSAQQIGDAMGMCGIHPALQPNSRFQGSRVFRAPFWFLRSAKNVAPLPDLEIENP